MSHWKFLKAVEHAAKNIARSADGVRHEADRALGHIHRAATGIKDSALSPILREVINTKLKDLGGKMIEFKIDTYHKKMDLTAELKGESHPISVSLDYEIVESDGKKQIKITSLSTSREWINRVAEELLSKKALPLLPIPSGMPSVAADIVGL